ncbi:lipocalin family protein [Treponema vincentii]|uniref:lipocalin family protein n=1 Tax=Treponema vincentii TaxID=69710 RepID=UPI0020A35651|nr:lipocalin family protein [Treponema vincentii]UTC49487.1 lipocalin family protein [Treponema vincentii]
MKKIVSAMALCIVLFGAITMVTGCGSKPAKGSVWKVASVTVSGVPFPIPGETYLCFHSDGNAYHATKLLGLTAVKLGTYTIDNNNITIEGKSVAYTLKGSKMTLNGNILGEIGIPANAEVELQKVDSPTQEEIAKAAL